MKSLTGILILMLGIPMLSGCSTQYEEALVPPAVSFADSEYSVYDPELDEVVVVNPASYAIDRDSATYWSPAANQPLSGLKAATEDQESSLVVIWTDSYDFCKVVLNVNTADSTLTKGGGKDYVIEYATMTASGYGNATWTQVASGQQGPGVTSVENNFVNPVSTSMLRLHYLSTYGHIPVVNEVVAYKRIERQYLFGVIPLFKQ